MALPAAARIAVSAGGLGLVLTVLNQLTAPVLATGPDPALERAAVLASILAVVLILVGLLWERVQPAEAGRAPLQGREGLELEPLLPQPLARELAWGSTMLLTATPAAVLLLQWGGQTLLRRGLLQESTFSGGAICGRAQQLGKAISLVDLRLYPGRDEFDTLLSDLPAVVVQPLGERGLLLLGGWSARCFSRSDLSWIEGWAARLTDEWGPALDGLVPVPGSAAASPGTG
jgi:hypothetical protein